MDSDCEISQSPDLIIGVVKTLALFRTTLELRHN